MIRTVTPLPSIGDVIPGRDVAGRELRISGHPESDRVVLSIWQDGRCQATLRLARADVPEVTRALAASLVPTTDGGHPGTVHELHPSSRPGTGTGTSLREVTDRIATYLATTIADRLRRFGPRP